jgi:hypothetical protein
MESNSWDELGNVTTPAIQTLHSCHFNARILAFEQYAWGSLIKSWSINCKLKTFFTRWSWNLLHKNIIQHFLLNLRETLLETFDDGDLLRCGRSFCSTTSLITTLPQLNYWAAVIIVVSAKMDSVNIYCVMFFIPDSFSSYLLMGMNIFLFLG